MINQTNFFDEPNTLVKKTENVFEGVFDNYNIEIIMYNGEPLFNARDIGECLDIDSVTVRRHIQSMNNKQVIKLTNSLIFSDTSSTDIRKLNNAGESFLTEAGVYKVISSSKKLSLYEKQSFLKTLFKKDYFPCLVFKESEFFSLLEEALLPFDIEIKRQFSVGQYRIDGYIETLKIAIEFDENNHDNYNIKKDNERTAFIIKNLNCRFIRVSDKTSNCYNIGYIIKKIFNIGETNE
jgi:very-short-patch-repair endonuclease